MFILPGRPQYTATNICRTTKNPWKAHSVDIGIGDRWGMCLIGFRCRSSQTKGSLICVSLTEFYACNCPLELLRGSFVEFTYRGYIAGHVSPSLLKRAKINCEVQVYLLKTDFDSDPTNQLPNNNIIKFRFLFQAHCQQACRLITCQNWNTLLAKSECYWMPFQTVVRYPVLQRVGDFHWTKLLTCYKCNISSPICLLSGFTI